MKKWLFNLLNVTAIAYSCANAQTDPTVSKARIRNRFIKELSQRILQEMLEFPKVKEILHREIYTGEARTLLAQICIAMYRKYIEEWPDAETGELILSKKNLEKLDISPASLIKYAKMVAPYLKDVILIKDVHLDGFRVRLYLELVVD